MPEGWLPFIRRQYDDFSSAFKPPVGTTPPTRPNAPPQTLTPPKSWEELKGNLYKSYQGSKDKLFSQSNIDLVKNPVGELWKRSGIEKVPGYLRENLPDVFLPQEQLHPNSPVSNVKKNLNALSGLTTGVTGAALGTTMDVMDPRNTGSETKPAKPMSDVLFESGKAAKRAVLHPELDPAPSAPAEFFKRVPSQDPISEKILTFVGEEATDLSNAFEPGAHALAGMFSGGANLATIPMWLLKQQHNIDRFSHATDYSHVPKMLREGFSLNEGGDVLSRYAHAGLISKEDALAARQAGEVPQSKTNTGFGPAQMPVDFAPNVEVFNALEPMPYEDIQKVVAKLHPDKDRNIISDIWAAWREQAPYVVPRADQISGAVPFQSVRNPNYRHPTTGAPDPTAWGKVKKLGDLLTESNSGVHGLGPNKVYGSDPLNHPGMETEAWQAVLHRDQNAGSKPTALGFDPRVAMVSDIDETPGSQKILGLYGNQTFPKDKALGDPVGPVPPPAPGPGPVASPVAATPTGQWTNLGQQPPMSAAQKAFMKNMKKAGFSDADAQAVWASGAGGPGNAPTATANAPNINPNSPVHIKASSFNGFIINGAQPNDIKNSWATLPNDVKDFYKSVFPSIYENSVKPHLTATAPAVSGDLQSHIADLTDILETNGVTVLPGTFTTLPSNWTAKDYHTYAASYAQVHGNSVAKKEIQDLWDMKAQPAPTTSQKWDVFNPVSGKAVGTFKDEADAKFYVMNHPDGSNYDYIQHDPVAEKGPGYYDFSNMKLRSPVTQLTSVQSPGVPGPVSQVIPADAASAFQHNTINKVNSDIVGDWNKLDPATQQYYKQYYQSNYAWHVEPKLQAATPPSNTTLWNALHGGDQEAIADAFSDMNGPESADFKQKYPAMWQHAMEITESYYPSATPVKSTPASPYEHATQFQNEVFDNGALSLAEVAEEFKKLPENVKKTYAQNYKNDYDYLKGQHPGIDPSASSKVADFKSLTDHAQTWDELIDPWSKLSAAEKQEYIDANPDMSTALMHSQAYETWYDQQLGQGPGPVATPASADTKQNVLEFYEQIVDDPDQAYSENQVTEAFKLLSPQEQELFKQDYPYAHQVITNNPRFTAAPVTTPTDVAKDFHANTYMASGTDQAVIDKFNALPQEAKDAFKQEFPYAYEHIESKQPVPAPQGWGSVGTSTTMTVPSGRLGSVTDAMHQAVAAPAPTTPKLAKAGQPVSAPVTAPTTKGTTAKSTTTLAWGPNDYHDEGLNFNGVPFKQVHTISDISKYVNPSIKEPPLPTGKKIKAGIVVVEPDGRVWTMNPKNQWAGYNKTFPKGAVNTGETAQEAAVREVFEETGLVVKIKEHLTDVHGSGKVSRYYVGERVGGAPWGMGDEAEEVGLHAIGDELHAALKNVDGNSTPDHEVLAALQQHLGKQSGAIVEPPKGYPSAQTTPYANAPTPYQLKKSNVQGPGMGMHEKHIYSKGDQDYLFKPTNGPDFVPHQEVAANKISELGGLYPIDIKVEKMDGEVGTMQALVGNKTDWPSLRSPGQSIEKLTTSQLKDIIKNHPVDWLVANHDAHRGQWLITPTGVIGIDKGQAFKFWGKDKLDPTYNPNAKYGEEPSIYGGILKLWKDGKLPQLSENDVRDAIEETVTHLDNNTTKVENELYESLKRAGKEDMYTDAVSRFMTLRQDLSQFWSK